MLLPASRLCPAISPAQPSHTARNATQTPSHLPPICLPTPPPQSLLRCRWAPGQVLQLGWVLRVAIGVASALEHMHYR